MAKVRFTRRAQITDASGQIIYGQEGQEADLDGDVLESALAEELVELAPEDDADAAAAEAAQKAADDAAAAEAAQKAADEAAAAKAGKKDNTGAA